MLFYVFSGLFLCGAPDFTDHDYALRLRVVLKEFQHIYECGSYHRVSTYAYGSTLPDICLTQGIYYLISKGSGF